MSKIFSSIIMFGSNFSKKKYLPCWQYAEIDICCVPSGDGWKPKYSNFNDENE